MTQPRQGPPELSVVVPLYNEEESLNQLAEQILAVLRPLGLDFELVLVDDGSKDNTPNLLSELAARVPELVAVLLGRNYGQTAAMAAGFDASSGAVIAHRIRRCEQGMRQGTGNGMPFSLPAVTTVRICPRSQSQRAPDLAHGRLQGRTPARRGVLWPDPRGHQA